MWCGVWYGVVGCELCPFDKNPALHKINAFADHEKVKHYVSQGPLHTHQNPLHIIV